MDVAVALGFAFQAVPSKLCFGDKSQQIGDLGGWECAQNMSRVVVQIMLKTNMSYPFRCWRYQ